MRAHISDPTPKGGSKKKGLLLLLLTLVAGNLRALPESELIPQTNFVEKIQDAMAQGVARTFESAVPGPRGEKVTISYFFLPFKQQDVRRSNLVIFPGYSEPWLKYDEVLTDLWNAGHQLWIMDHRGMGLSSHLAERLAHVGGP